jgi:branched-chain amino acid transport system ATP-binding protein
MALFDVQRLTAGYNRAPIVHDVSLSLEEGEILTIIGPNGAGKSTLIKAIFGLCDVLSGEILLGAKSLAGLRPSQVVSRGISYVPQVQNVFPNLTVKENLEMGAYLRTSGTIQRIGELTTMFPDLGDAMQRKAIELSGGQRNMLALARALMTEPRIILLDEPTAGLAPKYAESVWSHVMQIAQSGIGVVIVEQNARRALESSDRGLVMAGGQLVKEGPAATLLEDEQVAEVYLGGVPTA